MLCNRCGLDKPTTDFVMRKDRGTFKKPCRQCATEYSQKWKLRNPGKSSDYVKKWTEKNRDEYNRYHREYARLNSHKYRQKQKEILNGDVEKKEKMLSYYREKARLFRLADVVKNKARALLRYAVASGKIKRLPCFECGTEIDIHGHHEDYSKPLDVIWLCRKHHLLRHRMK